MRSPDGATTPVAGATARRLLSALAVAAVFVLIGAFSWTRIVDTDLFWHLASGDWILSHHAVPRLEPFSYTASGRPWVDIHWLYQAALALLYRGCGLQGLALLRTVLILGLFAFLYVRGRRDGRGRGTVGAALLLAAIAGQERFLIRPEIVSWLLMAACLATLDGVIVSVSRRARRARLWLALPFLQVLWVNIQSLFILGPVLVALALAAAAAERIRGGNGADDRRNGTDDPAGDAPLGDLAG